MGGRNTGFWQQPFLRDYPQETESRMRDQRSRPEDLRELDVEIKGMVPIS
jgi:hypothetical protein